MDIEKRANPAGVNGEVSQRRAQEIERSQHYRTPQQTSNESPPRSRARKHLGTAQSLYSGQDRLGHVQDLSNRGWRAFGRRGQPLGLYETRAEAIAAVGKALREGQP